MQRLIYFTTELIIVSDYDTQYKANVLYDL